MLEDFNIFDFSSYLDGHVSNLVYDDWGSELPYSLGHSNSFGIVGSDMEYVAQTTPFTCAVVSQQMILNDFGINVSEAQLVYDAASNGWLTHNGTSLDDMGKLLEYYGVSTHTNFNGDLPSMIDELSQGHKIIVPVNSDELWNGISLWQKLGFHHNSGFDHAVVVTGVDFSDQANPKVIINDPGHPNGAGQAYPLEHFLEAWNDSNYTYLATNDSPVGLSQHAIFGSQFNEDTGRYSTVDFWIEIGTKIAGVAVAMIIEDIFLDTYSPESYSYSDFSPWELLTDITRDQLFLEI